MKETFEELLTAAVEAAGAEFPSGGQTIPQVRRILNFLLRNWYTGGGGSFYFLFRKNLSVTNVSLAELAALIRLHASPVEGTIQFPLQFLSSGRLKTKFYEVWPSFQREALIDGIPKLVPEIKALTNFWYEFFSSTILFDALYGSAVVHVPRTMRLKLSAICGEAGYIYACGEAVYIRRMEKAGEDELLQNLTDFLSQQPTDKTTLFVPYSHEHFDRYDEMNAPELINGLADVKLHLDKLYLGTRPVATVLRDLRTRFDERLFIPDGTKHYKEESRTFFARDDSNKEVSLWLLTDTDIADPNIRYRGQRIFYVCYAQRYRNANPFIGFDESKPGWVSPVTLPHTLAAAMLNLTRSAAQEQTTVVDPFAGTGTTFLEAIKLPGQIEFTSGDINPISQIIINDNIRFFSMKPVELDEIKQLVRYIRDTGSTEVDFNPFTSRLARGPRNGQHRDIYAWAVNTVGSQAIRDDPEQRLLRDLHSHEFSGQFFAIFGQERFRNRLCFYLVWRAVLRNWFSLSEQQGDVAAAIKKEASAFLGNLKHLLQIRSQEATIPGESTETLTVQYGEYSPDSVISADRIRAAGAAHVPVTEDAVKLLSDHKGSFDVVITDPPYNFNATGQEVTGMIELYAKMIPAMIGSLKPEGQLVFCLPDISRNGQRIPAALTRAIIVQQILREADVQRREVYTPAWVKPEPSQAFSAPFYWHSERALSRAILHLRFRSTGLSIC